MVDNTPVELTTQQEMMKDIRHLWFIVSKTFYFFSLKFGCAKSFLSVQITIQMKIEKNEKEREEERIKESDPHRDEDKFDCDNELSSIICDIQQTPV